MGIKGLPEVLKPYLIPVEVSRHRGKRAAVDAYSWLHKGMYGCAYDLGEEAGEHATDDERSSIEAAISEAEDALKSDDKDTIEAATTKLTEATSGVAQKMYAAQAEAGEATSEQAAPEDDVVDGDVVDAEFEEVREDDKR